MYITLYTYTMRCCIMSLVKYNANYKQLGVTTMTDIIGYARVSTKAQKIQPQIDILNQHGATKVFSEHISGKIAKRPELLNALEWARAGDTFMVTKIDRLARNVRHLLEIAERLKQKGVSLKILNPNIDTSGMMGELFLNILGAVAQFEVDLRAERQREGIAAARERGTKFGPKPKLSKSQRVQLYHERMVEGWPVKQIMDKYSIGRTHVYNMLQYVKDHNECPLVEDAY